MDERENKLELEDILKEFAQEAAVVEDIPEEYQPEPQEEAPEETVADDTVRLDTTEFVKGQVHNAQPILDEEEWEMPQEPEDVPFEGQWEPEYEQPMGEYVPPQPIIFHPRSRLRELKRKLVAGPEKRYYALSEVGVGKLQAAIFLSMLVVLISAGSTVLYALGMVPESRMRLMVFGQFLAMLLSALLGYNQLINGFAVLLRGRFTLNTLLILTFAVCTLDGIACLQQLRVPCCAAFSLEMTMSMWSTYQRRNTELAQMDTMRKATRLNRLSAREDYCDGRKGFLRSDGEVEDFMDTYAAPSKQEKILSVYSLVAAVVAIGIGVTAGVLHNVSTGIQVTAVSLLAAMPATAFITVSRPEAILQRRLHKLGTVICGWQGVEGLCGKAVFPLNHEDLFPSGTMKMNGVKFFGSREPDEIVAYATALVLADDGGLAPVFSQLLDARNGRHYEVENFRTYENGGIGGEICGEPVLVGPLSFLKEMGVDLPDGVRVSQAVCVAVDGQMCGLFAVVYERSRASMAGIHVLSGYRGLRPVLITGDFALTPGFLRSKFGVNPKRIGFPEQSERSRMRAIVPQEESRGLLLTTREGLASYAYGVAGARTLHTACKLGTAIHMAGGILGLAIMLTLTLLSAFQLLTPANMFLYQMVWIIPGLLVTEWTRVI